MILVLRVQVLVIADGMGEMWDMTSMRVSRILDIAQASRK